MGRFAICWASLRLAEEACWAAAIFARMAWGEVGDVGVFTMLVNLQDDKGRRLVLLGCLPITARLAMLFLHTFFFSYVFQGLITARHLLFFLFKVMRFRYKPFQQSFCSFTFCDWFHDPWLQGIPLNMDVCLTRVLQCIWCFCTSFNFFWYCTTFMTCALLEPQLCNNKVVSEPMQQFNFQLLFGFP